MAESSADILDFSFESVLNEATVNLIDNAELETDIVTFCEHPNYLDQPLHSVEKFILKVYYGLPLDDEKKDIKLRSYPHSPEGRMVTEVEYANFLTQQGRTNLPNAFDFKACIELILACGRRGGKTFLASVISSYEAYKLIIKNDPQKYYKLPQGEEIRIINVASAGDQALILAKATQNRILNSKWFAPYVEGKTQDEIRLRTKRDLELIKEEIRVHGKALDMHASIKIEAMPCTARGIRGGNVIVAILDEVAHYIDNTGNRSGDVIYEALTPSIATFGMDGKILCISSPYVKGGIFYDLFMLAKGTADEESDQNKRMFQIPTWEMNETITFEFLDSEKKRNPESFHTEFGAEFSSRIIGFFKYPEKIDACIKRTGETSAPEKRYSHYIAVDPSSNRNGYALAMVHVEQREKLIKKETGDKLIETKSIVPVVVLDKWKVWKLTDPEFVGQEYIDEEVVEDYVTALFQKFVVSKIVYDQYESTSSVNKFRKMGYTAEKTSFTRQYNMAIYSKFRNLVYEDRIELFPHEQGILEVKSLQEIKVGKRQFIVEAPKQGEISTDDLADVLANACYVAVETEIERNTPTIIGTNGSQRFLSSNKTTAATSFQAYRRKLMQNKIVTNIEKARSLNLVKGR